MSNKRSFTLIEVIVAISILSIGIMGAFSAFPSLFSNKTLVTNKLTAYYLVQEGVEIVKNLRDTNYLKIREGQEVSWSANFCDWNGLSCDIACAEANYCGADYSYDFLVPGTGNEYISLSDNFYLYDPSSSETIFKRRFVVECSEPEVFCEVRVDVLWNESSGEQIISAQENIYNWMGYSL